MIDWLHNEFTKLISNNCSDGKISEKFWSEIKENYTSKSRYYHNLSHIYNMFQFVEDFKNEITDFYNLKLAIWYHDIVYKFTKKDNEEKSALFAENRLKSIDFDEKRIEIIKKLIISTKKHQLILIENKDNDILLDLDLSIFGSNWKTYQQYIKNIRKEYKIYPNFMYNPTRKKVLKHFLNRENLYFTERFQNQFENQARKNIEKEIQLL